MNDKNPEPNPYDNLPNMTTEYWKHEYLTFIEVDIPKLIAEFIQKLKDLPTWSSRDNIFTINQANINDLIEEYEDSRK